MPQTQALLVDSHLSVCGTAQNPLFVAFATAAPSEVPLYSLCQVDSSAGNKLLVTGVAGKRIKIYALSLTAPNTTAAVTVTFTDGAGGNALFEMLVQTPAQSPFVFSTAVSLPSYLFATSAGNGLYLNLSIASQLSVNLSYWVE